MQVELLRSWLRLIAKHKGIRQAERARRWTLLRCARVRWRRREPAAGGDWLASGTRRELLGLPE